MKLTRSTILFPLLLLPLVFLGSGCNVAAAAADRLLPPEVIHAKYVGLQGQSVGVLVWTDRGVQIDYPTLSLDLANSIQKKLIASGKSQELKETIFPVQPASIARYILDHPNYSVKNVTELAPKLGVTRLLYVEVEEFSTRAPTSVELYRGAMTTTLKVVESTIGQKSAIAYDENNIQAVFPPKVTEAGTPDGDDVRFYAGTIDAMSTEIVHRLVSYEKE